MIFLRNLDFYLYKKKLLFILNERRSSPNILELHSKNLFIITITAVRFE